MLPQQVDDVNERGLKKNLNALVNNLATAITGVTDFNNPALVESFGSNNTATNGSEPNGSQASMTALKKTRLS